MKKITIFDTSIGTRNKGDEIIVDSVNREIDNIFQGNTMYFRIPTHDVIGKHSHRLIKESNYSFVAGTNLLSSRYSILRSNQWKISISDALKFERVILVGVGWTNYQNKPSFLSKKILNNSLDSQFIHSVRDNYTKEKLNSIGIDNVVNTGCPTMWQLTPEHCMSIPVKKAKNVIMTLTDYRKDIEKDKKLIEILTRNYDNVYFWIQGSKDEEYISQLTDSVKIVNPTLAEFDNILESDMDIEYIGTRLHAGIRALQKKRRSIIIGVDNRAKEKKSDFNLNVIDREDIDELDNYINSNVNTSLRIDFETINMWKSQFYEK